jgi:hypothetical protein
MRAEVSGGVFRNLFYEAGRLAPVDLALALTLLDLLLRPVGDWTLRPFILIIAAFGLLIPGQLRNPALWLLLALLTGLRVVVDWPLPDNHAYLLFYWCLAISLALLSGNTPDCLALNARLLVGLVFAFATLWKLGLSTDYADGRFFRVTMLVDSRFEGFAQLVGGLTPEGFQELRGFVEQHVDGAFPDQGAVPEETSRFKWVARVTAWWNIVIDGAIAIAFLWPIGRGISTIRHSLLLFFCVTTFAIATVEGFGWLLIAMGVAQCSVERQTVRLLYLGTFGLIVFYREVPWAEQVFLPLFPG